VHVKVKYPLSYRYFVMVNQIVMYNVLAMTSTVKKITVQGISSRILVLMTLVLI